MSVPEVKARGKTKIYNEKGMCVIPKEIRQALGIEKGDRIMFLENDNGNIEVFSLEE